MGFKELLNKGKIICLATASNKGKPNAIFAESLGIHEGKILIADVAFDKTLKNLKENNQAAITVQNKKEYYQIKGTIEYFKTGKWLELVKKINSGTPYKPKAAVLISIKQVYDLDKQKKII